MLDRHIRMVERFHREITGMPMPPSPTLLQGERRLKALEFLGEELAEFQEATTIADQADALVDLIYVAYGKLLEMGIMPGDAFDLVHDANMKKVSGANKRGGQYEAAKPKGWEPPDWDRLLGAQKGSYIGLRREKPKPKVLLLGYGRHGKDTVAEMLRDDYGLSFTSSSMICTEKVMMPHFEAKRKKWHKEEAKMGLLAPVFYTSPEECFADRHNHRQEWFDAIEQFNSPDKSALGRVIFRDHDVYCGLRSAREFAAIKNAGLYDVCIWVDALTRVNAEGRDSCTVEPWMADYVLDNNGTPEELRFNLRQLMATVTRRFDAQH